MFVHEFLRKRTRNLTQPFDTPVLLTQNGTQGERRGDPLTVVKKATLDEKDMGNG